MKPLGCVVASTARAILDYSIGGCPVSESSNFHYTDKVDMALTFTSVPPTSYPPTTPRSVRQLHHKEFRSGPRTERTKKLFMELSPACFENSRRWFYSDSDWRRVCPVNVAVYKDLPNPIRDTF